MNNNAFGKFSHADIEEIIRDAKRCGSMKSAYLRHSLDGNSSLLDENLEGGVDTLFSSPQFVNQPFVARTNKLWAAKVLNGVTHRPFAKIKSGYVTPSKASARNEDEIKEEIIREAFVRYTDPATIYVKQKFDRDDIVDEASFDMIPFIRDGLSEDMEVSLATAILFGTDDIPNPTSSNGLTAGIRAIIDDSEDYVIDVNNDLGDVREAIGDDYMGSGNLTMIATAGVFNNLYSNAASTLTPREFLETIFVRDMILVPNTVVPSGMDSAIILDLADYVIGNDRQGDSNFFSDFDIDYNTQTYLLEARRSGALVVPKSVIKVTSQK